MPEILREHFQLKETIVTISAYEQRHIETAKRTIIDQRAHLEKFIRQDPFFVVTLDPYDIPAKDAPEIVKLMVRCGNVFGIGPMSAVAGVIAKFAVESMIEEGASYAIVDNGGDIAMLNDQPVLVGVYAGQSSICNLAFEIPSRENLVGIATSSGTVGPSISFGYADAATVVSNNPALADAAATALGNAVLAEGPIDKCFKSIDKPGILGALVIRGDEMALWGELPILRRAKLKPELITKA
ncbi:MAG: UPF0280 family protein [Methanotrichaceae archaeon]|nr:UPF0280 family protein [Methanotrichaceae archaeon]